MVDALSTVKTVLDNDWTAGNTDSLTPTVTIATQIKSLDLGNADHIILYEVEENIDEDDENKEDRE